MVSALRGRTLQAQLEVSPATKSRNRGKGKSNLISQPPKPRKSPQSVRRSPFGKSASPSRSPSPFVWQEPVNPQATLLGIPSELRLQIYGHVFSSILMHVHREEFGKYVDCVWQPPRYFWTQCRQPNPDHPMLCANPKYSALCSEQDRCTYRPDDPAESHGAVALRRTCRFIYEETKEHAHRGSTVSIHPRYLDAWLSHLQKVAPKQLESIRQVTLMGADNWRTPFDSAIGRLKALENLEAVAFQGQVDKNLMFNIHQKAFEIQKAMFMSWHMLNWLEIFPSNVKVVAEAFIWLKHRPRWAVTPVKDCQWVVTIVRKAYEGHPEEPASWDDEHVQLDAHVSDLINSKRTAKWRMWWRANEVKHYM